MNVKRNRPKPSRRTRRRVPKHADPWSLRRRSVPQERVVNLHGREIHIIVYRQGGVHRQAADFDDPLVPNPVSPPERSMLSELRRRVAAEISKYRTSGICSDDELRLIVALWQAGVSLRKFAKQEGVSPAAIGDRIERLQYRAPRFYRWWLLKNRRRREACQRQARR